MLARLNPYHTILLEHTWLFPEIMEQLEKDLDYPGLFDDPSSVENLERAYLLIRNYFKDCIQYEPDNYYAILYKSDLSEFKLKKAMVSGDFESLEEVSAVLVLERIVQKVLNRNRYSGRLI